MKPSESDLESQYPKMPSIPPDIEISQNASIKQIPEIASMLNIVIDGLEQYGKFKAKISVENKSLFFFKFLKFINVKIKFFFVATVISSSFTNNKFINYFI